MEVALADVSLRGAGDPRVGERVSALEDQLRRRLAPERAGGALAPYAPTPPFLHPVERRVQVLDLDAPAR